MDLAHATVIGPSEIASPSQMEIHLNNVSELAMSLLQSIKVNSIEISISFVFVATSAACGLTKFITRCSRQLRCWSRSVTC